MYRDRSGVECALKGRACSVAFCAAYVLCLPRAEAQIWEPGCREAAGGHDCSERQLEPTAR